MTFAAGMAVGAWATVVAVHIGLWLQRRSQRRLAIARAVEMSEAIKKLFAEPTPGCGCDSCRTKRGEPVRAGVN